MGTRNFDLGTRDMKAAGRIALEQGMRSFASIDTMSEAKERDRTVRAQIAQELGHNRIEVTHTYLG